MTADPHALLPLAELVQSRTPRGLRTWVLEKCRAIADVPETARPALLHVRPFKQFYEEIYPFSLFAARLYGDRDDVVCVPNRDEHRDFDAEVREGSRHVKIEITLARDPQEHLRMEYFLGHGHVSLSGPLTVQGGRKEGRRITVDSEAVEHGELRARHLAWIKLAAEGKAGRGRYGGGYELVIAVDDWWYKAEQDATFVGDFIAQEILALPLSFRALHLVGWTERLYTSFVVPHDHIG